MATVVRLVTPVAALLLAGSGAAAQPPTAPPPHPPLAELVTEYQRLGLPVPPPNAQLVRIEKHRVRLPPLGAQMIGTGPHADGDRYLRSVASFRELSKQSHVLVYRVPPPKPGGRARHLLVGWLGVGLRELEDVEPDAVVEARPEPDAARWVAVQSGGHLLAFAINCKVLGWDDLAAALYARARERLVEEESDRPVLAELREIAWGYWAIRLTARGTDRKDIDRRLGDLLVEEPALRTEYNAWLLGALGRTVAPRKSVPGTVESLIDDLTEYWAAPQGYAPDELGDAGQASYWALAERGFDAVPALIEHTTDDRLTRAWVQGFNNFPDRRVTVGHLCSRLLARLSAGESGGGWVLDAPPDPATAHAWFDRAKKVGEEGWLLARAMPPDEPIADRKGCPDPVIVRVIGAKYPARLPEVYRAWLRRPFDECDGDFADEVAASTLPRDQKVGLLKEGAARGPHRRRLSTLEGLARLGSAALREPLRTELTRCWAETLLAELTPSWGRLVRPSPEPVNVYRLLRLTEASDDRACWDALAVVGRAAGISPRLNLIWLIGEGRRPDQPEAHRLARIRCLVKFLDDETREVCAAWDGVQVRDHAADWLAVLLGFRVERPKHCQHPGETRGTLSRLFFRAAVRQAAARELAAGG
jgi:hypothetical protein